MTTPCHSGVHSESNVQWLQVQPWNNADPWSQYGIVASRLGINEITVGTSGIAGMPMIGIDGHLGPHVAMMMGGRRGHSGKVNRKSASTGARLQNGTEIILRWLSTNDVPSECHGMLLRRALTGCAKLLISHFRGGDLLHWDAGQRIFDVLAQAHKHISEFEDQDDFDNAFYKLHRERNQMLLQFANVARAAYLEHDACGHPLLDRTKGMIFLRQAKIPGHLEDHITARPTVRGTFPISSTPSRVFPGDL